MIVHDLNIMGAVSAPSKTDAPLAVDPDAPLPLSIATKLLEPVPWRHSHIINPFGTLEQQQLGQCRPLDPAKPA